MARLFSTTFNYNKKVYTAMVTISGARPDTTITINIPDASLHKSLPGGKIILNAEKKIQLNENDPVPDPSLIAVLLKEVEKHEFPPHFIH